MNEELHSKKVRLINRLVDLYFDTGTENRSQETTSLYADWLSDSDFEKEKDAALYCKFEKICEANTPETEVSAAESANLQKSLEDVWRRIREHEESNSICSSVL